MINEQPPLPLFGFEHDNALHFTMMKAIRSFQPFGETIDRYITARATSTTDNAGPRSGVFQAHFVRSQYSADKTHVQAINLVANAAANDW
jgi:hypothetical protein